MSFDSLKGVLKHKMIANGSINGTTLVIFAIVVFFIWLSG